MPGSTEKGLLQRCRVTGCSLVSQMWPCLNWVLKNNKELAKVKNKRADKHSRERRLCTSSQRQKTKALSRPGWGDGEGIG